MEYIDLNLRGPQAGESGVYQNRGKTEWKFNGASGSSTGFQRSTPERSPPGTSAVARARCCKGSRREGCGWHRGAEFQTSRARAVEPVSVSSLRFLFCAFRG